MKVSNSLSIDNKLKIHFKKYLFEFYNQIF